MKFELVVTGKSALGKDIPVYKTGKNHSHYVYIMAGTHGDEPEGIHVMAKLFSWLHQNDELKAFPLIAIPVLNPDGVELQTRTNGNKVDLNRNYKTRDWKPTADKERYFPGPYPMSEPENQFLASLFKAYPPAFILSFHSWKPIIDYNGEAKTVAEFISKRNGYPVQDYIGYPTPGSFGTYIQEEFNIPVITFECPEHNANLTLEMIWQENEKAMKDLFLERVLEKFIKE